MSKQDLWDKTIGMANLKAIINNEKTTSERVDEILGLDEPEETLKEDMEKNKQESKTKE